MEPGAVAVTTVMTEVGMFKAPSALQWSLGSGAPNMFSVNLSTDVLSAMIQAGGLCLIVDLLLRFRGERVARETRVALTAEICMVSRAGGIELLIESLLPLPPCRGVVRAPNAEKNLGMLSVVVIGDIPVQTISVYSPLRHRDALLTTITAGDVAQKTVHLRLPLAMVRKGGATRIGLLRDALERFGKTLSARFLAMMIQEDASAVIVPPLRRVRRGVPAVIVLPTTVPTADLFEMVKEIAIPGASRLLRIQKAIACCRLRQEAQNGIHRNDRGIRLHARPRSPRSRSGSLQWKLALAALSSRIGYREARLSTSVHHNVPIRLPPQRHLPSRS